MGVRDDADQSKTRSGDRRTSPGSTAQTKDQFTVMKVPGQTDLDTDEAGQRPRLRKGHRLIRQYHSRSPWDQLIVHQMIDGADVWQPDTAGKKKFGRITYVEVSLA